MDLVYRQRLLAYIERVCTQCMLEEIIDEGNPEPGGRVLQPMIPPDHLAFDTAMKMDVFDIVRSRQFHNK